MTIEIPSTIVCEFSCKENANSTNSQDYSITVDLSDISSEDILEWACNNGIVVYLQGRVRAGKIKSGDTVKLHKPGTRSSSIAVDGEEVSKWKPILLGAGQITADTTDKEIAAIIRAIKKLTKK